MDRFVVGWKSGIPAALPTTVHVVRHGESLHNARYFSTVGADLNDGRYIDAGLTARGAAQANALVSLVAELQPELIVSSPLTRALDTCMRACTEWLPRPIVVNPVCTERLSFSCDIGSPMSVLQTRFPGLDFTALHPPEAWWWSPSDMIVPSNTTSLELLRKRVRHDTSGVEPETVFVERVSEFRRWLVEQPFTKIIVFGHGAFLRKLLIRGQSGVVPHLQNCEVRTLVL